MTFMNDHDDQFFDPQSPQSTKINKKSTVSV